MRTRLALGFFILGVVLLTVDPLAGQPGGGKFGRGGFGGFGPPTGGAPGTIPAGPGGGPTQPGAFQFQPGAQPGGFGPPGGGGFNRGGGGRDPEQVFTFFSKGANAIDLGQMPAEQKLFVKGALEKMGLPPVSDTAVITKDQFVAAYAQVQAAKAAAQGQAPGGAPMALPGQPGAFPGQPGGGFTMQFGGKGGGMSEEEIVRRFQSGDRNQDGRLTPDEASDRTKQAWNEIDVNRDGALDVDEYKNYYIRVAGGQPGGYPMQPGGDFRGTGETGGYPGGPDRRREEKKDDFSNVAVRFGKLPPGLPDWFAEYDTDKDGQVNMYEWRTVGGKALAEFRELDANGDGLIAPLELIRLTAVKAETDRLLAIQEGEIPQGGGKGGAPSGKGGSMSGRGGPPGGGPGAFMTGKGGPPSAGASEARPSRDEKQEKREEKGGPNPFRGFGGKK